MVGTKVHQGVFLFISFLNFVLGLAEKKCNVTDLIQNNCADAEICVQSLINGSGVCKCMEGYSRVNGTCYMKPTEPPSRASFISDDQGSGGHAVAGIFISIFVIAVIVCGVYVTYRYRLIDWVRNKMSQRNVDYDEFMIGQDADDDPPLN